MKISDGFAARLREERERLGLSQRALGEVAGVAKLAQLNYEKGARSPSIAYLDAVSGAGLDVWYMLTGERFDRRGVDAGLLAACISAIDGVFGGSVEDRAQLSAVLYQSTVGKSVDFKRLPEQAEMMLAGWNFARSGMDGS